jgi:hypothetical protein
LGYRKERKKFKEDIQVHPNAGYEVDMHQLLQGKKNKKNTNPPKLTELLATS